MSHKITIPGMTTVVCRENCSDKDALYYYITVTEVLVHRMRVPSLFVGRFHVKCSPVIFFEEATSPLVD